MSDPLGFIARVNELVFRGLDRGFADLLIATYDEVALAALEQTEPARLEEVGRVYRASLPVIDDDQLNLLGDTT